MTDAPAIDEASFAFDATDGPVVTLTGRRFTYANPYPGAPAAGSNINDLRVIFRMPAGVTVLGTILPGATPTTIRVRVPQGTVLGLSRITVTRPGFRRNKAGAWVVPNDKASNPVSVSVPAEYVFSPLGTAQGWL